MAETPDEKAARAREAAEAAEAERIRRQAEDEQKAAAIEQAKADLRSAQQEAERYKKGF